MLLTQRLAARREQGTWPHLPGHLELLQVKMSWSSWQRRQRWQRCVQVAALGCSCVMLAD